MFPPQMCSPNDFPLKKQSNFNVGALIIVDCCYLAGGGKTYTMVGQPVSSFAKLIKFDKLIKTNLMDIQI